VEVGELMKADNVLRRVHGVTAALIGVPSSSLLLECSACHWRLLDWRYCCPPRIPNQECEIMKLDPAIRARIQFAFTVSFLRTDGKLEDSAAPTLWFCAIYGLL
jgi:hypothetical protein